MAGIRYGSRLTQYEDDQGAPLAGGSLTFYATGTTTLQATYNAPDLVTPNANPMVLDAAGRQPADTFLDDSLVYRVVLKNAAGVTIADDDPVSGAEIDAAIESHNDDLSAHYAATESQRGFTEYANHAELLAGDDPTRSVTAEGLNYRLSQKIPIITGGVINSEQASIASAATINLDSVSGNYVTVSGTASISTMTLAAGRERVLLFQDAATIVHNPPTIYIPGAQSITTAANDMAVVMGSGGVGVRIVSYTRYNGGNIGGENPTVLATGSLNTSGNTVITIPSGYKKIRLEVRNMRCASEFFPYLRLNADTGSNYRWGVYGTSQSVGIAAGSAGASTGMLLGYTTAWDDSGTTQNSISMSVELLSPDSAASYKDMSFQAGMGRSSSGDYYAISGSGRWIDASAITSATIALFTSGGASPSGSVNATSGTYYVVGEK